MYQLLVLSVGLVERSGPSEEADLVQPEDHESQKNDSSCNSQTDLPHCDLFFRAHLEEIVVIIREKKMFVSGATEFSSSTVGVSK